MFGNTLRTLVAVLLLVAVAVNFSNVFGRYVLNQSIFWAEEILIYVNVWMVFLAGAVVSLDNGHLSVDVFRRKDTGRLRRLQDLLADLVILVVAAAGLASSWTALSVFLRTGQKSVAAGIPMSVPHSALLAGFALIAAVALVRFLGGLLAMRRKGEDAA